jgi:hypothetical protein
LNGSISDVPHPLLDQAGEGREHQRALDSELVHQFQARAGLAEGRDGAHRLAEDLAAGLALGVAVAEVVLHRAGTGDHLEGGVGDVVTDLAPYGDLRAAVDLHVLDGVRVLLGEVAGERLLGLVQVVVAVEERIWQLA